VASWSSRGPTAYDLLLKPDLAAPGVRIASAQAAGAYLPTTYPARHVTGDGANAVFQLSGTSQAAAVVSGAAALLLDDRSNLNPSETKAALQLSASFISAAGLVSAGAGSLNLLAAVELCDTGELAQGGEIAGEVIVAGGLAFGELSAAKAVY